MTQLLDYKQIAALALAKCAAYDPWFPKASQSIVDSWGEQLKIYKLGLPDVLAGVTKMYSEHNTGFRPLPKDLTDAARSIRRERTERETTDDRHTREAALDARVLAQITARTGITVGRETPDA